MSKIVDVKLEYVVEDYSGKKYLIDGHKVEDKLYKIFVYEIDENGNKTMIKELYQTRTCMCEMRSEVERMCDIIERYINIQKDD